MADGAGGAEPQAEPPLPAVPEAAEGALPQGPGPAIPPEISAQGAAAGRAAAEAQPDAALQPVQVPFEALYALCLHVHITQRHIYTEYAETRELPMFARRQPFYHCRADWSQPAW